MKKLVLQFLKQWRVGIFFFIIVVVSAIFRQEIIGTLAIMAAVVYEFVQKDGIDEQITKEQDSGNV